MAEKLSRKDLITRVRELAKTYNLDIGVTVAEFLNEESQVMYLERYKYLHERKGPGYLFETDVAPTISLRTLEQYEERIKNKYEGEKK